MKTGKLVILMIGMVVCGMTMADAQSKKEKIAMLTRKMDSLEKVLSVKNESSVQLQVKLARLEGATDAHNEEIKRLEDLADSLRGAVIARNMTIESQASKINQLNLDINGLQTQQKEWTAKSDSLVAELNSLKQKPIDAAITLNEAKPAELPKKDDPKTKNLVSGNKPNPTIKN